MSRLVGALALVVLLAACGSAPAAQVTPPASASPSASPRSSGLFAFPGPCELPVVWASTTPPNLAAGGGFVTFPGASFAADAAAHTSQWGEYWFTYNTVRKAWLPVLQQFATPDGTKYLYFTLAQGTLMRLSDATTGQYVDLENDSVNWFPVGLDNFAAYAMGEQRVGLWRLPFEAGKPVMLVDSGVWVAISAGYAWGFATATVPTGAPTVLQRLSLTTGEVSNFATFQQSVNVIGLDRSGLPILSEGSKVVVLSSSGDQTIIASNFLLANAPSFSYVPYRAVGDANGVWLAGEDGMYLAANSSVNKVSMVRALPAGVCS